MRETRLQWNTPARPDDAIPSLPGACMIATHFVTGATGLVGSAIVLELLQRTTDDVFCLVRPGSDDVTARLRRVLGRAVESYAAPPEVQRAIAERCHAVAGDVVEP